MNEEQRQKLLEEAGELQARLEKFRALLRSGVIKELPIRDGYLIFMQSIAMRKYARILLKRIERANKYLRDS